MSRSRFIKIAQFNVSAKTALGSPLENQKYFVCRDDQPSISQYQMDMQANIMTMFLPYFSSTLELSNLYETHDPLCCYLEHLA